MKPNYANAYNKRGVARAEKLDLDGAISDYTLAIKYVYKRHEHLAFKNRGNIYNVQGNLKDALEDYEEALRLKPDDSMTRSAMIGVLRKLGMEKEAKEHEEFVRNSIENENEYNRACFEAICGNTKKALELLRVGLEKNQSSIEWAKQDPDFENLRNNPRFKELVGE